jgi:hypothetical protein
MAEMAGNAKTDISGERKGVKETERCALTPLSWLQWRHNRGRVRRAADFGSSVNGWAFVAGNRDANWV